MSKTEIIIFAVLSIAAAAGIYIRIKKKEALKTAAEKLAEWLKEPEQIRTIKQLCVLAEEGIVGTKKGQERLAWVSEILADIVPRPFKEALTPEVLEAAITAVFKSIAKRMTDGSTKAVEE